MDKNRGIMTIALGRDFADYAKLLAKCLDRQGEKTPRAVLTTEDSHYFEGLYDVVIPIDPNDAFRHDPFFLKFHLIHYTPFEHTLFLDADTLVFDNLDYIWTQIRFSRQPFFSYGFVTTEQREHYGAPWEVVREIFGTDYVNVHNGGLYFFSKGEVTREMFRLAESSIAYFDEVFARTNERTNHVSDEVLLAYGMSRFGLKTFPTHIYWTRHSYSPCLPFTESVKLNVRENECKVKYNFKEYYEEPIILHYSTNPVLTKHEVFQQVYPLLT